MEYRKLISFGKSSYVVSLPKGWVVQNKLKKGDLIYLEESGPNLVLTSNRDIEDNKDKESVINVDGKTIKQIDREVTSAYIQNSRLITLKGKEIKLKVKELQQTIQNLIALEVMEQTSESIVAKDFINMDTVSADELIRKMDIIVRTMMQETCDIFKEDNYESINERDKDVNRLYFLLYRAILFNLDNPTHAIKRFKLRALDLMKLYSLGFYLEGVADEVRRSARFLIKLKISRANKDEIEKILREIYSQYLKTIKAAYNNNPEDSLKLSTQKSPLFVMMDKLEEKNVGVEHFITCLSRIRRLISYVHNIGRVTYTLGNY
jgi:phosphate uptake regulator